MVRSSYYLFSSLVVLVILGTSASAQTVAWYRFNDGATGQTLTTAIDSGPNHLDGTSAGLTSLTYGGASGLTNSGTGVLNASGDFNFVRVNENAALDIQGDLTIETYFQMNSDYSFSGDGLSDDLVQKQNNPGFGTFLSAWNINLRPIDGDVRLQGRLGFSGGDGVALTQVSGSVSSGVWHHTALVLDRDFSGTMDSLTLYLDGQQIAQTSGDFPDLFYGSAPLYIGAGNYGSDPNGTGIYRRNFGGLIDEVRITSGALSTSQFLNTANVAAPEPDAITFVLPVLLGSIAIIRRKQA